jgi:hypothetical protein
MTLPRPLVGLALVAALLCGTTGCGGRSFPDPPKTYPVKGTITSGGRPLSGGTLLCILITNNDKYGSPEAPAQVQPDGSFEPQLFGNVKGLYPGVWKVKVTPIVMKDGQSFRIPEPVAAKYTKEETTDLQFEVKEGDNTPALVLEP